MIKVKQSSLWIFVIPFILLACGLGSRNLNEHPLWDDEANTIRDARGLNDEPRSLDEIWTGVAERNPDHAPGYFMLLNLWARLVGWHPILLRSFSLLVGLIAIAVTYRLGREWLSAGVGLAAAIILSVSPFYAFFFDQMRVYTLTSLFSVLTLWFYVRIVNSPRPRRWWVVALFGCVVVALYSHYLTIIMLAGIGAYHLLFVPKNRRWWLVTIAMGAGALVFLPWVSVLLRGLSKESNNTGLHQIALSAPEVLFSFLWMFSNGAIILMLGLVAAAITRARGSSRYAPFVRQILIISTGALIALLVINHVLQIMGPGRLRYLMPLWPLFALVIGVGVMALQRWRSLRIGLVAVWIIVGLWASLFVNFDGQLDGSSMTYPIDDVATALVGRAEKNDIVVNYLPDDQNTIKDETFQFYLQILSHLPVQYTVADKRATSESQLNMEERLWKTFEGRRRIWISYSKTGVPSMLAAFEAKMRARDFQYCLSLTDQPAVILDLYVTDGVSCPATDSPST